MSKQDFVESSGNVFTDMGLMDADELLTRSQLGHVVRLILEEQGLQQPEIAEKLGIKKAEASRLMNGKYHLFSEKRLLGFLDKLNKQVLISVVDRPAGEPAIFIK